MNRFHWLTMFIASIVLLAAGGWFVSAGIDGLEYQREWPTMSDGTEATAQLVIGALLIATALAAGWLAVRARRRG